MGHFDVDSLVRLRHDLHAVPEVGLHLPATQARLLDALDGLGLGITLGRDLSSITAVLRGRATSDRERKVVLLRGDMDGLPLAEQSGEPFASTNSAMHACGHDLHMAGVVGAAQWLADHVEDLPGDVVFMFQPGEEGADGARRMIDEGVLEAAGRRPDMAFAIHVWASTFPSGTFVVRPGAIMAASDPLDVTVLGRGGHGSAPHRAADPVPAMAEMITALQVMLARHFDLFDPALITVGRVEAGQARNVIPDTAHFEATMRSFSPAARDRLWELVPRVLDGVAASHGVAVEHSMTRLYPVTSNHAGPTRLVEQAVTDLFGTERLVRPENPMSAAEDFSKVLLEVPGAFVLLGAAPVDVDPATAANNHSASVRYSDDVIGDAARLLAELAVRSLR